jgi:hypothetical protein
MRTKTLIAAAGVGAVLAAVSVAPPGVAASSSGGSWSFLPVATHLNEPRGIDFDNAGSLYVAEAGYAGSGATGVTHTGAVSKFVWAGSGLQRAWSTRFTSIFAQEGGDTSVLGPAAVSASGRGCNLRHPTERRGCLVQGLLSESRHGIQAQAGISVPQIGHLYRLNGVSGRPSNRSDVGDQNYSWTGHHRQLFPDDFPDANPYGMLTIPRRPGHGDGDLDDTRTFVADAGANTISEILPHGYSRVIAYIPNETSVAKRDATPTCIAQGPDGMLYVGALDLVSNFQAGPGQSNVWRVNPNSTNWRHNATLWATGYTTINGCTFDKDGNFWASELFYPNSAGPPGDLAMAPFAHPNAIHHIGLGSVPLPGGIAQGPDGAMYVSVGSADPSPHSGAIMRVEHR